MLLHSLRRITTTPVHQLRPGQKTHWLLHPQQYRWIYIDFQDQRFGKRAWFPGYLLEHLHLPRPSLAQREPWNTDIEELGPLTESEARELIASSLFPFPADDINCKVVAGPIVYRFSVGNASSLSKKMTALHPGEKWDYDRLPGFHIREKIGITPADEEI